MKAPLTLGLYGLGLALVFGLSFGAAGVVAGSFAPPASVEHTPVQHTSVQHTSVQYTENHEGAAS